MDPQIIDHWLKLISEIKYEQVIHEIIQHLKKSQDHDRLDEMIQLKARFSRIKEDKTKGLKSNEDFSVGENQLIIALIHSIRNLPPTSEQYKNQDPPLFINQPAYNKIWDPRLNLADIGLYPNETLIGCIYEIDTPPPHNGPNINRQTYLRDVQGGRKFPLIELFNVSFSPDRRSYQQGKQIAFQLIFPPIPKEILVIDLIESEKFEPYSFNILGINLKA
ncbi:MAG: hypothetical protein AAF927_05350 [Bacteroidota bacterium]